MKGYYCPITRKVYHPTVDQRIGYYYVSNLTFPEYRGYFNVVVDDKDNQITSIHQHSHIGAYNREMFKETNHVCWKKVQAIVKELLDNYK